MEVQSMRLRNLMSLLLCLTLFTSLAFAQSRTERQEREPILQRPSAQSVDVGYALLDKGELVNCYMNMGQITDSYLQTPLYDFMWPKSRGIIAKDDNACDDFSYIFAYRGNVIDGWTAYRQEDWGPVVGHLGYYHAKDQPEEMKYQGFPQLAQSDVPLTWPTGYFDEQGNWVETPGVRHWPGPFRLDIDPTSPTFGQEVPGEFAADRVVYSVMDDHDNLQGPPLGIRVEITIYSYGRPYAADFQFYDFLITNTSDAYLDSCWWGYYYDFDYGDYTEEAYVTFSAGLVPGPWDVMYQFDPDGTKPGEMETGVFGVAFLKTPKDVGITDSHFFLDTGPQNDRELWPIITSNPNDPNLPGGPSDYFHGPDPNFDDYSLTFQNPQDWVVITASGPFSLAPAETVRATIAVLAGENEEDFRNNVLIARDMFLKGFQGPSGPQSPTLTAVPGDGYVTLYWDDAPERKPDPFTGEYDFEGYKIYRSVDDGQTWGEKILDGRGQLVGWVPIAQFDLDNDIQGLDPLNANNFLGSNTGIVHSWTDTDVINGVVYSYTITAYDRGDPERNIPSMESPLGTGVHDRNFVQVTPEARPTGYIAPSENVEHISGVGKATVSIDIVDPDTINAHAGEEYRILFDHAPAEDFIVVNATRGDTLIRFPINTPYMPVREGFSILLTADTKIGGIKEVLDEYGRNVLGAENTDTTGSWYVRVMENIRAREEARASDYEIRFTAAGSWAGTYGPRPVVAYRIPFEVWNLTRNEQVFCELKDIDKDSSFDEGEPFYILDVPYQELSLGESIPVTFPDDFPYQVTIMNAPADTLNRPPQEGQKILLSVFRGLTPDDVFRFTFEPIRIDPAGIDLEQIRVVPNPYVVSAAWERGLHVRKLRFMFLPPECTIKIFTTRGELVAVIEHTDGSGEEDWNITSYFNQDLAYGLYIYVVETPDGRKKIGKFALIK